MFLPDTQCLFRFSKIAGTGLTLLPCILKGRASISTGIHHILTEISRDFPKLFEVNAATVSYLRLGCFIPCPVQFILCQPFLTFEAIDSVPTGWTVRGSYPGRGEFSVPVQTGLAVYQTSYMIDTWSFPGIKLSGVVLTTHTHLAPRVTKAQSCTSTPCLRLRGRLWL